MAAMRINQLNQYVMEVTGGEGGIRTLDRFDPIHAFQACSFSHSDTSPKNYLARKNILNTLDLQL